MSYIHTYNQQCKTLQMEKQYGRRNQTDQKYLKRYSTEGRSIQFKDSTDVCVRIWYWGSFGSLFSINWILWLMGFIIMDELTYPKCPKCNSRVVKKGKPVFATPPHKRQQYQCTECGYPFVPEITENPDEPQ